MTVHEKTSSHPHLDLQVDFVSTVSGLDPPSHKQGPVVLHLQPLVTD